MERNEAPEAGAGSETNRIAPPDEAVPTPPSSSIPREGRPEVAAASSSPRGGLVTSRKPLLVLGRVVPGKLSRRDGCIVVEIEGSTFTAVFPPNATLVSSANGGEAVTWPGRSIPVGETARIPGGGSVTRADLAAAPPAGCPEPFYAIAG